MLPTTYHSWEHPTARWRRLHTDFAMPFQNHMFLIVVDAMPEVIKMTTANITVNYTLPMSLGNYVVI